MVVHSKKETDLCQHYLLRFDCEMTAVLIKGYMVSVLCYLFRTDNFVNKKYWSQVLKPLPRSQVLSSCSCSVSQSSMLKSIYHINPNKLLL